MYMCVGRDLAYNFVRIGLNYGRRIVRTLRFGADMNVLAIYEK
jgi:hypothetical protein